MTDERLPLQEAAARWDRAAFQSKSAEGEARRQEFLAAFPRESWPLLELERYALGTDVDQSFCWWLEYDTAHFGSIGGGNAMKHLMFRRSSGEWYFPPGFANESEAWSTLRGELDQAIEAASVDDFGRIAELPHLQNGARGPAKAIYLYNPDSLLPIFAKGHRDHYMRLLGGGDDGGAFAWEGCRRLLDLVRSDHPVFRTWTPDEIMHFLYDWASPIETTKIVKIAPGHGAELWADCRDNGYIRVGWDEVGDLRDYPSKEEFTAAFAQRFTYGSQAKVTEKANEVWTLTQLQPGDIVVANRGTARIVGIGRVIEPTYQRKPELGDYGQTVAVDWYDTQERDIDPIKRWAFKTIAPVSQADYERILRGRTSKPDGPAGPPIPPPAPEPILGEVDRAIRRKGQVILFGPPGTGKTYTARRFSVWWLAREEGEAEPDRVLVDHERFLHMERRFSTVQAERRVWWVVANPAVWSWDRLFRDDQVDFGHGRLQANYPRLNVGDLVVGYQSNPDKRIVALARISEGLHDTPDGPRITLTPVAPVTNGPTYEELGDDATLRNSEAMRNQNRGTLFSLTGAESEYLLAWLKERDSKLPELESEISDAIGPLTRVTFHPSYTYEDFVEGYKPVSTGTGMLELRLQDGVFKRLCRTAETNAKQDYLLLIDEINRGNIPKIFGELITLLERDKRGVTVVLPQSGESFAVPPNVYVIGTMNTADRSIRLLDAALRRRFAFIELMPETGPLEGGRVGELDLVVFLTELNRRVARIEGREKQIGHSYLLDAGQPVSDPSLFASQFRHEILPLLQEYAYEDYRELAEYIGTALVDVEEQRMRSDVLDDPATLTAALAAHLAPADEGDVPLENPFLE